MTEAEQVDFASGLLRGQAWRDHQPRRHFVDGATDNTQLAASGTMTPDEHGALLSFTVESIQALFNLNRYARYVVVFQNWLKPAGASFDHLHKQLVAVDERGVQAERAVALLRDNPNVFNENAVNYAGYKNLVLAENDHAIAFAGFGHRFPSLEIYSKSAECDPWEQAPEKLRHVRHAARDACGHRGGRALERRVALPADRRRCGHALAHRAEVAHLDPGRLRRRHQIYLVLSTHGRSAFSGGRPAAGAAFEDGRIVPDLRIGTEAECRPNSLQYLA
ncbi:MAG: DUF4921 family protein [Micropruina glycogenica]